MKLLKYTLYALASCFILYKIISFYFFNVQAPTKNDMIKMLESENKDSVLTAYHFIIKNRDTSYNSYLLKGNKKSAEGISHSLKFYGKNTYQSRMYAIRAVTGIEPPRKITYKVDSLIIDFYLNLLKDNANTTQTRF